MTNGREEGFIGNVEEVIKDMNQVIVSGADIVSEKYG